MKKFQKLTIASVFAVLLGVSSTSVMAQASTAETTHTIEDIALVAGTCATCHGQHGKAVGGVPTLRGVKEDHLYSKMMAYKEGKAHDDTVMGRLMRGYDDQQIKALAEWFSKEKP